MKPYLRRQEAIAHLATFGMSERVWKQLVARQIIKKVYVPPLAPGESPDSRRAFYSSASVARAGEEHRKTQNDLATS